MESLEGLSIVGIPNSYAGLLATRCGDSVRLGGGHHHH